MSKFPPSAPVFTTDQLDYILELVQNDLNEENEQIATEIEETIVTYFDLTVEED